MFFNLGKTSQNQCKGGYKFKFFKLDMTWRASIISVTSSLSIPIFSRNTDYKLNQGVLCSSINLKLNSILSRTWKFSNPSKSSAFMASRFKIRQGKSFNVFHKATNHGLQRVNIVQYQICICQPNCNQKIYKNEIQIVLKYGFKYVYIFEHEIH